MNENKCYVRIRCALSYCEIFNKRYFLPIIVVLFFFKVSFADAAPYMMATEGTLERVNNDLKSPVTIDRFRPNIVISGPAAFGEVFFIYTQNLLKTVCYR